LFPARAAGKTRALCTASTVWMRGVLRKCSGFEDVVHARPGDIESLRDEIDRGFSLVARHRADDAERGGT
jgi:hypothetical protein